jgi:hypothetical protein
MEHSQKSYGTAQGRIGEHELKARFTPWLTWLLRTRYAGCTLLFASLYSLAYR